MAITRLMLLDIAYRAGRASRTLRYPYNSNPYPESYFVRPERRDECAARRTAWYRGWIEADADADIASRNGA